MKDRSRFEFRRQYLFAMSLALLINVFSMPLSFAQQFPILTGYVVDEVGVFGSTQVDSIAAKLREHEQQTTNQVFVAVVDSLDGRDIDSYGTDLLRHWGVGQKDKNNGVLLVVAPNERKVRIDVGYGLEGTLTDLLAGNIVREKIIPQIKAGRLPQGIESGVDTIIAVLNQDAEIIESLSKQSNQSSNTGDPIASFAMMAWFICLTFLNKPLRGVQEKIAKTGIARLLLALTLFSIGFGVSYLIFSNLISSLFIGAITVFIGLGNNKGGRGGSYHGGSYGGGGFGGGGFGGGGGGSGGGGGASGGW